MALFTTSQNTTSFLKMGLMGFQGSGKTLTATLTAIGLIKYMRAKGLPVKNAIAFLDTEKGSDWVRPQIEAAGIRLLAAKTRSFNDLLTAVPEAQATADVLIGDSMTHFWTELCETYRARRAFQLQRDSYSIQFQDWAFLKGQWRRFTDAFVNSPLHIIIAGRAGYEYDFFEDEAGKKQLEKTGIKFKAEAEMGYEPDLLVLMERRMNMDTKEDEHVAYVVKDRSGSLDGKKIPDPTFESFWPHIRHLNLGGPQLGVDTSRNSARLVPSNSRDDRPLQRKIVLAEIEDLLTLHYPSTSGEHKKKKIEYVRTHFDNKVWEYMENLMPLDRLRKGYDTLHNSLQGEHSHYHAEVVRAEQEAAAELNDELPGDLAPPTSPAADNKDAEQPWKRNASASTAPGSAPTSAAGEKGDGLDIPKDLDRRRNRNGRASNKQPAVTEAKTTDSTFVDLVNA